MLIDNNIEVSYYSNTFINYIYYVTTKQTLYRLHGTPDGEKHIARKYRREDYK